MYHIYGKMAQEIADSTVAVGRSTFQKFSETYMIQDVMNKLELTKQDRVLEIGCGTGTLLFPLSVVVAEIYGIDHPHSIARLTSAPYPDSCHLIEGNWLEDDFRLPQMTKVIIYDVIHYTRSFEQAIAFIEKSLHCVPARGKILVGDIPNADRKKRFEASDYGKKFNEWWWKQRERFRTEEEIQRDQFLSAEIRKDEAANRGFSSDNQVLYFEFTDDMIADAVRHFRRAGHECYTLPQKEYLPFGHTREDLLIVKGA